MAAERVPETETCPVCDGRPRVLIAVRHPTMRRLILELLDRDHGCWQTRALTSEIAATAQEMSPDLVIIDGADFPGCCRDRLAGYPCDRIVVIGSEPDDSYRAAALRHGAGAGLARDDVGERLSAEMRAALGCCHGPCPPARQG